MVYFSNLPVFQGGTLIPPVHLLLLPYSQKHMGKEPGSACWGLKTLSEAGESLEANGSIVLVNSSSRPVKAEGEIFPIASWTTELPLANFKTWLWYSHFPNWVCECLNLNKQEAMTTLGNLGTISCCERRQRKAKVWRLENWGKFSSFCFVIDWQMKTIHLLQWVGKLPISFLSPAGSHISLIFLSRRILKSMCTTTRELKNKPLNLKV